MNQPSAWWKDSVVSASDLCYLYSVPNIVRRTSKLSEITKLSITITNLVQECLSTCKQIDIPNIFFFNFSITRMITFGHIKILANDCSRGLIDSWYSPSPCIIMFILTSSDHIKLGGNAIIQSLDKVTRQLFCLHCGKWDHVPELRSNLCRIIFHTLCRTVIWIGISEYAKFSSKISDYAEEFLRVCNA